MSRRYYGLDVGDKVFNTWFEEYGVVKYLEYMDNNGCVVQFDSGKEVKVTCEQSKKILGTCKKCSSGTYRTRKCLSDDYVFYCPVCKHVMELRSKRHTHYRS